jgi:hypothetical protein
MTTMEPSTSIDATEAAPANPLGELMPARLWVEKQGKPIFPSYDSFDWFVRQHQAQFATCPDWIVTGRGRFCGPGMAAFVRTLLDRETRAAMQRIVAQAPATAAVKRSRGRPRKQA